MSTPPIPPPGQQPNGNNTTNTSAHIPFQPAAKRPKLATDPSTPLPLTSPLSFPSPAAVSTPPILMPQVSSMAPPPIPAQSSSQQQAKGTDTTVLADALVSAGIDIKEEEAQLANYSAAAGVGTASSSFASTVDESGSFSGVGGIGGGIGGYGQSASAAAAAAEAARLRAIAEAKANHAHDPFLLAHPLAFKIYKTAKDNKLGTAFQGGGINPTVEVQTLISLAAKERLTSLLTRAVAIGRQRRQANGIITGEWAPLVKGGNKSTSSVSGRKRSHSDLNSGEPVTTLPNETARALRLLAQKEYDAERKRLDEKAAKAAVASSGAGGGGSGGTGGSGDKDGGSTAGTPGASGIDTPASSIGDGPRKLSQKEIKKQHNTKMEEEASHRAANRTAAVYFGRGFGLGKKKKTYSWMTGGSPAIATPVGSRPGSVAPGAGAGGEGGEGGSPMEGVTATGGSVFNAWGKRWGEWKEDGDKGAGVQLRDWIGALEGDGREGKAVVKAYLKLR